MCKEIDIFWKNVSVFVRVQNKIWRLVPKMRVSKDEEPFSLFLGMLRIMNCFTNGGTIFGVKEAYNHAALI